MTTTDIVRWILEHFEGQVYTDDLIDSGGATKWGITLRTWQYFITHIRGEDRIVTKAEIKALTEDDAVQCILALFVGGGRLELVPNWRLRFALVDWAIHSWYVAPVKALQEIIGGLKVDGILGPKTAAMIEGQDSMRLAAAVIARRQQWLDGLITARPKDERFRKGWFRRTTAGLLFVSRTAAEALHEEN